MSRKSKNSYSIFRSNPFFSSIMVILSLIAISTMIATCVYATNPSLLVTGGIVNLPIVLLTIYPIFLTMLICNILIFCLSIGGAIITSRYYLTFLLVVIINIIIYVSVSSTTTVKSLTSTAQPNSLKNMH